MRRLLAVATSLPSRDASLAAPLDELLANRFSVSLLEEDRLFARLAVGRPRGGLAVAEALQPFELHFPWDGSLLEERARVYQETRDPRAAAARLELEEFLAHEPLPFANGLPTSK